MIPSIHANPDASVPVPGHYYQAYPLTTTDVLKTTYLKLDGAKSHRCLGNLSWSENELIASLHCRVYFVNRLLSSVIEMIPSRDIPITVVSLGAGGLLTEYYINEQLKNSGYEDISWRLIDLEYQKNGYDECRKEFKDRVTGDVMAFSTDQKYLNKLAGHGRLAEDDKRRGAVILLSIDPPNALSGLAAEAASAPDCMLLRGSPVDDYSKANGIYLLVAQPAYKDLINKIPRELSVSGQVVSLDCALKCSIDKQGKYRVTYSPSRTGTLISEGSKPYLEALDEKSERDKKPYNLNDVNKALDKYLHKIISLNLYGVKFFVSDYDVSVGKLRDHFMSSANKVLFAALDMNEIHFVRKEF